MSAWILAIDTSTEACSVALGNGAQLVTRYTDVPRKHAEKVLPMVEELLAEASISRQQIAAIAFGRGPGAFTGLRIAASVVQGLAFALDIPVIPVSSLQALAQRGYREFQQRETIAAIDARMGELYWCCYRLSNSGCDSVNHQSAMSARMEPVMIEQLTAPANMQVADPNEAAGWSGVGTGWQYQDAMPAALQQISPAKANVFTHAEDVLTLALPHFVRQEWVDAAKALPVYLRNNVVQQKSS